MAFRDNSTLIRTATVIEVTEGGSDLYIGQEDTANAFRIEPNSDLGDVTFLNFSSNDSLINSVAIFDGNRDGFIQFGPNGLLDIDRSSRSNPGGDRITIAGVNDAQITELRYLGSKNGGHVYADSAVLKNLWTPFGRANVLEGDVTADTFDMGGGAKVLLHDNALGLNLGGDTINNFGADDLLVTTSALFDSDSNQTVNFGNNDVLDTSGANGPASSDPNFGPGGQLDFGPDVQGVKFLGSNEINGVTYYYYGTSDSTVDITPGV